MENKMIENTAKGLHEEIYNIVSNKSYRNYLDVACGSGALIYRLKNIISTNKIRCLFI